MRDGITHIIFGDLFLEDVRAYREQKLAGTGLTPVFPLWGRPNSQLAHAMIRSGLEVNRHRRPETIAGGIRGTTIRSAVARRLARRHRPVRREWRVSHLRRGGPFFFTAPRDNAGRAGQRDGYAYCDLVLERLVAWKASPDSAMRVAAPRLLNLDRGSRRARLGLRLRSIRATQPTATPRRTPANSPAPPARSARSRCGGRFPRWRARTCAIPATARCRRRGR